MPHFIVITATIAWWYGFGTIFGYGWRCAVWPLAIALLFGVTSDVGPVIMLLEAVSTLLVLYAARVVINRAYTWAGSTNSAISREVNG